MLSRSHPQTPQFKLYLLALALSTLSACSGSSDSSTSTTASAASGSASSSSVSLPSCSAPTNTLYDITAVQGTTDTSPLSGQTVAVRGVVTGDFRADNQLKGFFIQQPVADSNALTSEGLFVYSPSNTASIAVGDYVQVEGTIAEYKPSGETRSLTELTTLTATTRCGVGPSITPTTLSLPLASADALEAYEGMLVNFSQTLTVTSVTDLGHYGNLTLSANGRLYEPYNHPTASASSASSTKAANALNQIILDDGSTSSYPNPIPYMSASDSSGTRRVGDTVSNVAGPLTWSSAAWRVHPTSTPSFTASNPRTTAPTDVGGTLRVGHFNVENFFVTLGSRGATSATEFTRQRAKLVAAISGINADVLALMEVQNDGGTSIANLVSALNDSVGAGTYSYVDVGTPGDDEIIEGFIYKPAKVKAIGNVQVISDSRFTVSSGLRPSLAQRFQAVSNNGGFWMVANHLKSKGSCPSSSTSTDADYGQGCWNASRTLQAQALRDWVNTLTSSSGESDAIMVGDFNAYLNEDPLAVLEAAGFEALHRRLAGTARYSYVFSGQTGALDHAFVTPSLSSQVNAMTVWHINAEEPEIIDYTVSTSKTDDRYAATPYRSSDHDPVIVGLNLSADSAANVTTLSATLPSTATSGTAVSITNLSASNGTALSVNWGDGTTESLALTATSASHTYTTVGTYTITLSLTGSGTSATRSGSIKVSAPASGGTTTTQDLFFSEYVEGTSNNKAIEIYNPTSAAADLSLYTVRIYANGASTSTGSLTLTGTLAAGGTLVIRHTSGTFTGFTFPTGTISTTTVTAFNGDDALTLEKSGNIIDGIGVVGTDPGTAWTSGSVTTLDKTLRRKSSVTKGSIPGSSWDVATEWDVYDVDTFSGLGSR
ncbi:ExeM/NucH family extracellular endonuclease [Uliginosibacterium sediminicola]|uniref:ExeM/NucH family extracellular endonuclease n=1 Tax=Uliginosibacterium sediminicola TaxID=2024550 RepID=A0ABU9YZ94_9RHOO